LGKSAGVSKIETGRRHFQNHAALFAFSGACALIGFRLSELPPGWDDYFLCYFERTGRVSIEAKRQEHIKALDLKLCLQYF